MNEKRKVKESIKSILKAKEVCGSDSDEPREIAEEFLIQRKKFLYWKEKREQPKFIRVVFNNSNKFCLYSFHALNPYSLCDVRMGDKISFWDSDEEGKKNFLLYTYEINRFCKQEIIAKVTDFLAFGFKLKKYSDECFLITVFTGEPEDVLFHLEYEKMFENQDGLEEKTNRVAARSAFARVFTAVQGFYKKLAAVPRSIADNLVKVKVFILHSPGNVIAAVLIALVFIFASSRETANFIPSSQNNMEDLVIEVVPESNDLQFNHPSFAVECGQSEGKVTDGKKISPKLPTKNQTKVPNVIERDPFRHNGSAISEHFNQKDKTKFLFPIPVIPVQENKDGEVFNEKLENEEGKCGSE